MENKKSNVFLALFLSLLTALLGAGVFGVVYGFGYYIYLLALVEIIFSVKVFLKFIQNKKKALFGAILWSVILTLVLNVVAIVVCEAIFVAKELNVSFIESLKAVLESCKTDSEVQAYMLKRIIEIAAMIIIGGILYAIAFAISSKKAKKDKIKNETPNQQFVQPQAVEQPNVKPAENLVKTKLIETKETSQPVVTKEVPQTNKAENINEIYVSLYIKCKNAIKAYTTDKEAFKRAGNEIKEKVSTLTPKTKQELISYIKNQSNNADKTSIKINQILIKLMEK